MLRAATLLLSFALVLAGCAVQPTARDSSLDPAQQWQGRLGVKVSYPERSALTAQFVLRGQASAGQLVLSTPLGTTVATLDWTERTAVLNTGGAPQPFESLAALLRRATGVDVPVEALFEWLKGSPAAAPGWSVDLGQFENGRIHATRQGSDLQAEITLLLDR